MEIEMVKKLTWIIVSLRLFSDTISLCFFFFFLNVYLSIIFNRFRIVAIGVVVDRMRMGSILD